MSLFITSLNSGSNGNCYYVGNHEEGIFVDAGISCREIEKRMGRLGLPMSNVRAIFISHEHTDHIQGLAVTAKKYRLPVYITERTLQNCNLEIEKELVIPFKPFAAVNIGDLSVAAFPKEHDACDPHSFIVRSSGVNVGIFTDIGVVCQEVIRHFRECHAVFLEANYDEKMLMQGKYPAFLKNRIKGGKGHLSNLEAFRLFDEHRPSFMSHVILSHLSKENNSPELAAGLFEGHGSSISIIVASRHKETPVYQIMAARMPSKNVNKPLLKKHQLQLSLF